MHKVRKPSPSMVVSLIALFVALSGSAVAATLVTSRQIKNGTIQLKDISASARKALRGKTGPKGDTGATGLTGATGASGAAGTAVGYATVAGDGSVSLALNVATANVTKPASSTGFYCFSGLAFTPHNAQVTLGEPFPSGETLGLAPRVKVGTPDAGFGCPAGTQALVTIRKDAGGLEDHPFSILFN